MAIDLQSFASGDTDYIAKLNQNFDALKAAIDLLQLQATSSSTAGATVGLFFDSLFNSADALIGIESYVPEQSGTSLIVSGGGLYLASAQAIVMSLVGATLNFVGQPGDTYYVTIDSGGVPTRTTAVGDGSAWSVEWSGSAFVGDPVRICNCFYDANEAHASRTSTALGEPEDLEASPPIDAVPQEFDTLDDRLEAAEEMLVEAHTLASRRRKIGVTITDGGVAGAIQIDFYGTIVGWSAIGNDVGDLEVEVSRIGNSPPDEAPQIPDVVTDKISASAPISISSAQSAAEDEDGVSTWDTDLVQWDTVQFNVVTFTGMTRATLYLLIDEVLV